jgi:3-oxoacyl-[acyl-carrier-protein] synthase-1
VDSLLSWPTLGAYAGAGRLLTAQNSNGFMPGEGAGAVLVAKPDGQARVCCTGLGFAVEPAHIDSGEPLRADGLAQAIRTALADAGLQMHELDYRITDVSGEHYYFKEAALALARLLRRTKDEFDIWHPAECIGEAGAVAGLAAVIVAHFACAKGYSRGNHVLLHASNDAGQRAALILRYQVN